MWANNSGYKTSRSGDFHVGVTEVDARWLAAVAEPLVELSAPLDAPAPHYSSAADAVVATHAGMPL